MKYKNINHTPIIFLSNLKSIFSIILPFMYSDKSPFIPACEKHNPIIVYTDSIVLLMQSSPYKCSRIPLNSYSTLTNSLFSSLYFLAIDERSLLIYAFMPLLQNSRNFCSYPFLSSSSLSETSWLRDIRVQFSSFTPQTSLLFLIRSSSTSLKCLWHSAIFNSRTRTFSKIVWRNSWRCCQNFLMAMYWEDFSSSERTRLVDWRVDMEEGVWEVFWWHLTFEFFLWYI